MVGRCKTWSGQVGALFLARQRRSGRDRHRGNDWRRTRGEGRVQGRDGVKGRGRGGSSSSGSAKAGFRWQPGLFHGSAGGAWSTVSHNMDAYGAKFARAYRAWARFAPDPGFRQPVDPACDEGARGQAARGGAGARVGFRGRAEIKARSRKRDVAAPCRQQGRRGARARAQRHGRQQRGSRSGVVDVPPEILEVCGGRQDRTPHDS
jgi:hypothetical protein